MLRQICYRYAPHSSRLGREGLTHREGIFMFATEPTLCVIGLGYVGLPLAAEFGKHLNTIGFDINPHRIEQLRAGIDHTRELSTEELSAASRLNFTSVEDDIRACDEIGRASCRERVWLWGDEGLT